MRCNISEVALSLLKQLIDKDISIPENYLNQLITLGIENLKCPSVKKIDSLDMVSCFEHLIPRATTNLQHPQWEVRRYALLFLNELIDKEFHLDCDFPNQLIPLAIENLQHPQWEISHHALSLFKQFLDKDIAIPSDYLKKLMSLAIKNLRHPRCEVRQNVLLLFSQFLVKDILIPKEYLDQLNRSFEWKCISKRRGDTS